MKKRSFEQSLFTPLIVGNVFVFLVFALISYAIIEKSFSKSIREQIATSASVFTDTVRDDLVQGFPAEVLKKCKSFLKNENVLGIYITTKKGEKICGKNDINKASGITENLAVYFDEDENEMAAKLEIVFASSSNRKFIVSALSILALSFLGLLLILTKVGRIFIRNTFKPISDLAEALSTKNTRYLQNVSCDLNDNPETELKQLYEGVEKHARMVENFQTELVESAKAKTINEIYAGLVHDLKSPLSGITYMAEEEHLDPLMSDMLKRSVDRIYAQIDELLSVDLQSSEPLKETIIDAGSILKRSIEIKKYALESSGKSKINFIKKNSGPFNISVPALFFTRSMSNIIQNAIEATENINKKAEISIFIEKTDENVVITVKDNGAGISEANIPTLGRKGVTYNKEKGTGLGLYQVNKMLKDYNGEMSIESLENVGTEVKISLPFVQGLKPDYNIKLHSNTQSIIVLDDDDLIHDTWKDILKNKNIVNPVYYFKTSIDLKKWVSVNPEVATSSVALFDYNLKSDTTGLDVLLTNSFKSKNLITGESSRTDIQKKCLEQKINLIPKEDLSKIKFSINQSLESKPLIARNV